MIASFQKLNFLWAFLVPGMILLVFGMAYTLFASDVNCKSKPGGNSHWWKPNHPTDNVLSTATQILHLQLHFTAVRNWRNRDFLNNFVFNKLKADHI